MDKYKTVEDYFIKNNIRVEKEKEYRKYCIKRYLWGQSDVDFINAEDHIEPVAFIEENKEVLQREKVYFTYRDRKGTLSKVYCYDYYFLDSFMHYFSQLP